MPLDIIIPAPRLRDLFQPKSIDPPYNTYLMKAEEIKVGTKVTYWGFVSKNGTKIQPKKTKIASELLQDQEGNKVCMLKDVNGPVSINNLDPAC